MPEGRSGDPRGKLKAAARRWAGGRGGKVKADDPMTAQTKFPDWMEKRIEDEARMIELCDDEGQSFALFAALDTQWLRHAMTGLRLGLDYGQIEPTARMLSIEMSAQRFLDLRVMEAAALAEFARSAR